MSGEYQRALDALNGLKRYLPRKLDSAGTGTLEQLSGRMLQFSVDVAEFLRVLLNSVQSRLPFPQPLDATRVLDGAGTFDKIVTSGVYTPDLTEVVNVASSSVGECHWMRIENVVAVGGILTVTATADATGTRVQMTLPIASALSVADSVSGTAADIHGDAAAAIVGDTATSSAEFSWKSSTTSTRDFVFSYTYRIEE